MPLGLARFLFWRVVWASVLVSAVSVTALTLSRLAAGSAVDELKLHNASGAEIEHAVSVLGLDQSLPGQVWSWLTGLARFDLGRSLEYERPVAPLAAERAENTILLALVALAAATVVGVPLGIITGARPGGILAKCVTPLSVALVSCPPLVCALGLLLISLATGWLPTRSGSLAIPALALAVPLAASLERLQSRATTDTLGAPCVVAAAARGLPRWRLVWFHVARQSLGPVLGVYGLVIGSLLSGSLAVEVVSDWPGLGRLMFDALRSRDTYLAAGCALVGSMMLAAGTLAADVLRALADPRVREGR
jgi:peptide/nickel transport system permease protein